MAANIKCTSHITDLIEQCDTHLFRTTLNPIYCLLNTLINPYFEYCNIVWATNKTVLFDKLFILQKNAIRIITSSRWNTHTAPLFREKCILKICDINVVQVATFMFRYVNNLLPSSFANYFVFNSDIHGYETRQCKDIHLTYFSHQSPRFVYTNKWS